MPIPVTTGEAPRAFQEPLEKEMQVTVAKEIIGKSMKYVAYNQGYYLPGSNVSGWLEYSNVNSVRVWTSLNDYIPQSVVLNDKELITLEAFESCKNSCETIRSIIVSFNGKLFWRSVGKHIFLPIPWYSNTR